MNKPLPIRHIESWQEQLSHLITTPEELFHHIKLDPKWLPAAKKAARAFPLRATQSYVSKIQPNNPIDPLLLQILPLHEETLHVEGYSTDPLEENKANVAPGLIHKYHGRVLFVAAPQCAINCRYCFRRHFDYSSNTPSRKDWQKALEYIRQDHSIEEIIFSGGDPLVLPDKQLQWLLNELSEIKHLSRLRFHSRLPIVLPERITPELLNMLAETPLSSTFVIHCNHPQELDQNVAKALSDIKRSSVLLNQSVLLKNINDNADTLIKLSKDLFHHGALPYYLHLLDKVDGTAHFDVSLETAKKLNKQLWERLPGYLVPKLVKECPNTKHKVPIDL